MRKKGQMTLKRAVAFMGLMALLLGVLPSSLGEGTKTDFLLEIHPLEQMAGPQGEGYISSDETIATVNPQGIIEGLREGECTISLTQKGKRVNYTLVVDQNVPTEPVKKAIAIALAEWEAFGEKKLGKTNKYTKWYCNKECSFGWCGAFIGWAMDEAGVDMCYWADAVPVGEEDSFAIREAGVGKILTGYTKLERLTRIPRPGYLNIYGVRKKSNKTVHVGLITDVEPIDGERYLLTTVEGNIGTKIKRYQYYYDASDQAREAQENIFPIEKEKQTQEGINYTYAVDTWYVNIIGQSYE